MSTSPRTYWTRNLIIVWVMLSLWVAVTVGVVWFAFGASGRPSRGANAYWFAAYGAPLCYLLLTGLYAWLMRTRPH